MLKKNNVPIDIEVGELFIDIINKSLYTKDDDGHIIKLTVGNFDNAGEVFNDIYNNDARGIHSHAEGEGTQAVNTSEHAEGKYNISRENQTISTIGIGEDNSKRINAFEVHKDGSIYIKDIGGFKGIDLDDDSESLQATIMMIITSIKDIRDTLKEYTHGLRVSQESENALTVSKVDNDYVINLNGICGGEIK